MLAIFLNMTGNDTETPLNTEPGSQQLSKNYIRNFRLTTSNSRLNPAPNRVSKSCACNHVKGKVSACRPTNLGTTDPSEFSASQRSREETNCKAIRCSCIRKGLIQASKFFPLFSTGNRQGHLVHLLPKSAGWGCSCSFKRGLCFASPPGAFVAPNL